MKKGTLFVLFSLALALFLTAPLQAFAVTALLDVYPEGNNSFVVFCNAVNDVETMEITLQYDTASMEVLSVERGSFDNGSGSMSRSISSGVIGISARYGSPITGNGPVAVISYTPKPGRAGTILSLNGTMINSNGESIPVSRSGLTRFVGPTSSQQTADRTAADKAAADKAAADKAAADKAAADKAAADKAAADKAAADQAAANQAAANQPTTDQPATGTTQAPQPTVAPAPPTGLPAAISVSMPKDETGKESPEPPAAPEASREPAPAEQTAAAKAAAKVEPAAAEASSGVLERFRNYRGERSLQAFAALFKATPNAAITQEPWIVLSDGTAKATLLVKGQSSLNYSLQKAKRRSLKKAGENSWQLEVVPEKGAYQAALLIRQGSATITFPLTVAPPVEVADKDLSAYFQERAKGSTRFDLNKDGVINYIDDYIFTANYLATRQKGAGEPAQK